MREGCEDLWRGFSDLADANFVERFPFEFHQRWFEMYLGAALRRAKLDVTAPKPDPDLRVMVEGRPLYIEAIAPTAGHPLHADAVQEPVYRDDEVILKLRECRTTKSLYALQARSGPRRMCSTDIVAIDMWASTTRASLQSTSVTYPTHGPMQRSFGFERCTALETDLWLSILPAAQQWRAATTACCFTGLAELLRMWLRC